MLASSQIGKYLWALCQTAPATCITSRCPPCLRPLKVRVSVAWPGRALGEITEGALLLRGCTGWGHRACSGKPAAELGRWWGVSLIFGVLITSAASSLEGEKGGEVRGGGSKRRNLKA